MLDNIFGFIHLVYNTVFGGVDIYTETILNRQLLYCLYVS